MDEKPPKNTTYQNLASISDIQKEAEKQQKARLKEQESQVSKKQVELAALIQEAKEKHKFLQSEQERLSDTNKRDLDQLIKEAKLRQEEIRQQQLKELEEKRKEINLLQKQSEERIHTYPDERKANVKKEISSLLRLAIEKHQELESQQRENTKLEQQEFSKLVKTTEQRRQALQKDQTHRLKNYLNDMVGLVLEQQKKIKFEFTTFVECEKKDLVTILKSAYEKQEILKEEYKKRTIENKKYIELCTNDSKKLIAEGKVKEAQDIILHMQQKIRQNYEEMRKKQVAVSGDLKIQLVEFEQISKEKTRQMQQQFQESINHAKYEMELQAKKHLETITSELVNQTKSDLQGFEDNMFSQYSNLKAENIESIKKIKTKIEKDAGDYLHRAQTEQQSLLQQTKNEITEMERRFQYIQKTLQKDQITMITTAKNRLVEIERQNKNFEDEVFFQQLDVSNRIFKETSNLIQETRKVKVQEENEARKKLIEEKLQLGKESTDAQKKSQQEQRETSQKIKQEIVLISHEMQERLRLLQHSRQELTKFEQTALAEMTKKFKERQNDIEKEHLRKVSQEQAKFDSVLKEIHDKQQQFLEYQASLEEIIKEAIENQKNPSSDKMSGEYANRQEELMLLIKTAQQKQLEIQDEQKNIIQQSQEIMEKNIKESQDKMKIEQNSNMQKYQQEILSLQAKVEEKALLIKNEQDELFKRQENDVGKMLEEAEQYQKLFREEQKRIIELTQQKIMDIEEKISDTKKDKEE